MALQHDERLAIGIERLADAIDRLADPAGGEGKAKQAERARALAQEARENAAMVMRAGNLSTFQKPDQPDQEPAPFDQAAPADEEA